MLRLGTLVPEELCPVFYATRCQVYCRFDTDDMVFASTLIWYYIQKHTDTAYTRTNGLTHKYILIPPAHSSYLYYIELITHWLIKQSQIFCTKFINMFVFKNYLYVEVTYLLIRFRNSKYFLWNTKSTDRNCVNEWETYTYHTPHKESWLLISCF